MKFNKAAAFTVLIISLFSCAVHAAYSPDSPLPWDPDLHRETLDNGLQIYLLENHRPENRISIRLAVKAGSMYEEDGAEGVAHFLEHMAFNGTTHYKAGEIIEYLEPLGVDYGADLNASTGWIRTIFKLDLPTDNEELLNNGMQIMNDFATGILFDPEEIDRERGVILEEMRLRQNIERRLMRKAMRKAAPGTRFDSPRINVLGSKEVVETLRRDDFLAYYRRWYRPDRMALVMVGDIPVHRMRELAVEFFGAIPEPGGEPEFPIFTIPDHEGIKTGIITDKELPTGGGAFAFVHPIFPSRTERDYRRDRIDSIISASLNRRLRELKEGDDPPFLSANIGSMAGLPWFELSGGFAVTLQMKKEKKALQAVIRELERAKRHGILDTEIRDELRAMEESRRIAVKEKENVFSSSLAAHYASVFINDSISLSEEESYRLIRDIAPTITVEDVHERIKELYAPGNMLIGLALPSFQKSMYKESELPGWYEEVLAEDIAAYTREELEKHTDYSQLKPAKIIEREELEEVGVVRVKFENGLTLYLKQTDFQEDVISVGSYNARHASYEEPWSDMGITHIMERLWGYGGTEEFKNTEIGRLLKGKAFSVSPGMGFSGRSIDRDFEEMFQWMYDFMTHPGFREEALTIIKNSMREEIKDDQITQGAAYSRAIREILYPGHRRAVTIDDENYYEQFAAADIRNWWKKVFFPGAMQFTIVGTIDIDRTIELASRYLGNLPGGEIPGIPQLLKKCTFPAGYTRRVVYQGTEDKARVQIMFPGPAWDDEDFVNLGMAADILQERMRETIREEFGGTYSISMDNTSDLEIQGKNFIAVAFHTDPGRVEEMIARVDEIIAGFVEAGPEEDEIATQREVSIKDREEALKTNGFWMAALNGVEYLPVDVMWKFDFHEKYLAATVEDVHAAAKKWLTPPIDRVEFIAYKERTGDDSENAKNEQGPDAD